MSATLLQTEQATRRLTKDVDSGNYAVDSRRLRGIIVARGQIHGAELGYPRQSIASFVTLTDSGSTDFTPAYGGVEPSSLVALRLLSTGQPILVEPLEIVDAMFGAGSTATPGDPLYTAILEGTDQSFKLRFYPRPNRADTVSAILESSMASTLTDATVLPFSALMLRAIEARSAADSVAHMTQEHRARLGLGEETRAQLMQQAVDAEKAARKNQDELKRRIVGREVGAWW